MPIYERGDVRLHYEEAGSGFPLLVIPGGGLNASIAKLDSANSFNPMRELTDGYRCVTFDQRNSPGGRASGAGVGGPPWDSFADDHLGLMDHLGIERFHIMGFCIGGPFCWNLMRLAPERVVAAVLVHPSGVRPEMPDQFYDNNMSGWAPEICAKRPDIDMEQAEKFLTRMYRSGDDFLFTVTRDFVRKCRTPVLVMPDDIPPHPYAVAMESAMLAPNAQVSLYPWREPPERIPLALRHVRSFLKAHTPAS